MRRFVSDGPSARLEGVKVMAPRSAAGSGSGSFSGVFGHRWGKGRSLAGS